MPNQEMIGRVVTILMKHNPQTKIGATIVAYEIIKAMREPTKKMKLCAPDHGGIETYQSMIDSILND